MKFSFGDKMDSMREARELKKARKYDGEYAYKAPKQKSRGLIVIALVAVLATASTVNYKLAQKEKGQSASSNQQGIINAELVNAMTEEEIMNASSVSEEFFGEYRTQREKTRQENIALLEGIIADDASDGDMVKKAQEELIGLTTASEKEMVVESLIKAKGFKDVISFIHEGYVNVVVNAEQLTPAQAAQIQDIVIRECSVEASKVSIAISRTEAQEE